MGSIFDDFTNKYPVNKTLRFALKPIGDTEENIKKKGILLKDETRAKDYKQAKKIIDEYHKDYINRKLKDFSFDEGKLGDFADTYRNIKRDTQDKNLKRQLEKLRNHLRKEVANHLKNKKLFSNQFIKDILPQWLERNSISIEGIEKPEEVIGKFQQWTTYFTGFNDNRKNIYTDKDHGTSIGYRLIHENLPKFVDNIERYDKAKSLNVDFSDVERSLVDKLPTGKLENFFTLENFNRCLTQKGIDNYNLIVGGRSENDGTKKQGINEIINLHAQQLETGEAKKVRSCQLEQLYKQILSDRNTSSFRFENIETDSQLCGEIIDVVNTIDNVKENFTRVFYALANADPKHIYIKSNNGITDISQNIFRDWGLVTRCLEHYVEANIYPVLEGKKETKTLQTRREEWLKQPFFSIDDIHTALESYFAQYTNEDLQNGTSAEGEIEIAEQKAIAINKPLFDYFKKCTIRKNNENDNRFESKNLFEEVQRTRKEALKVLEEFQDIEDQKLKNDKEKVQHIKNYLDALLGLQYFLKPLHFQLRKSEEKNANAYEKDGSFYTKFDGLYEVVQQIQPLYNKARNYLTKKPYSEEKYKLNFENQTLADGWDKSRETSNSCVLLLKNGRYYLAVMDKEHKRLFEGDIPEHKDCYKKMVYKLLPGPNKMLPKVFFSDRRGELFDPPEEILHIRNVASHVKNGDPQPGYIKQEFNLDDMHKMIDFFKTSIEKYEKWRNFGFQFSSTKSYENISSFYKEVSDQGYKITFQNVSKDYIDECVKKGNLYLFQIYSKDFSDKSKGKPNLQTLYWKALFDEENLKDVVYKLDGGAELFHRKASIHYKDEIWEKGHHADDPKKKQPYPIIKDRRYARDTYHFHVPITCNFKAENSGNFNEEVTRHLKNNDEVRIIGIDRGERHLAYYTVIDQWGKIIEQGSLNNLNGKDYHDILDKRENARDKARKSWGTIEKIKDLKEGYLSQVVNNIAKLIIEHNAIVVFEDLNFGFKRGRFKIEKQVYQNLEKRLIDKLNYLVFKDKEPHKNGGTFKALQLTARFESFQKLGKQTGFIFYVPAYHTSKICPATGFVNLLYPKYETIKKAQEFFSKFDKICYNKDEDYFEFHLDYGKFTDKAEGGRRKWVICTHGTRLENFRDENNQWDTREVDLVEEMKKLFQDNTIDFKNGECLIQKIKTEGSADFFRTLIRLLRQTLQMRNSRIGKKEDWFISPVKDANGVFFDSRKADSSMPKDADANGAYHIALKGLLMLKQLKGAGSVTDFKPDLSNKAWYEFVQEKPRL